KQFITFAAALVWFLQISTLFCSGATGGRVVAWGYNCCGQTDVPPDATNVVAISAGSGNHSYALKKNGTMIGWGYAFGMVLPNVKAIAAGSDHGLALRPNGSVVAWGTYFVTGGGSMPAFVPDDLSNVTAIACGSEHDLALKSDGTIEVWGSPDYVSQPPA